jgi:hypothetical protein
MVSAFEQAIKLVPAMRGIEAVATEDVIYIVAGYCSAALGNSLLLAFL